MLSAFRGLAVVLLLTACGGGGTSLQVKPMPEGGNFTGVYFSPQYGEMHIVQNGSAAHGKYEKDERSGKLQGEVEGNTMRFEWTEYKAMVSNRPNETRGHGYFEYVIDPANGEHLLKGRWGLGDDDANGGEWNAYKARNREPDVSEGGDSGGESEDENLYDDEGGDEGGGEGDSEGGDDEDIF